MRPARPLRALALVLFFASAACGARTGLPSEQRRPASEECQPSGPPAFPLTGTIRDFSSTHPDFESFIGDDRGIVASTLGPDGKPVYTGAEDNPSTHGQQAFDAWYHDVPGQNRSMPYALSLTSSDDPSVVSFEDDTFFPIDGELLGNEGRDHNYHFTYEAHARFERLGGEVLTFGGDDDLFAFVGGRLVVELGGVHGEEQATLVLDDVVDDLGIATGAIVPLDLFFAERHTSESRFRLILESFALCE